VPVPLDTDRLEGVMVPKVVLRVTDPLYEGRGFEARFPTAFTVNPKASPSAMESGTVSWKVASVSG
jgi:hypothetical protein